MRLQEFGMAERVSERTHQCCALAADSPGLRRAIWAAGASILLVEGAATTKIAAGSYDTLLLRSQKSLSG